MNRPYPQPASDRLPRLSDDVGLLEPAPREDLTMVYLSDVVMLELSELSFVDSSGLGAMVWVHKTSRRCGATVVLHAPGRSLRMLLCSTGLDTVPGRGRPGRKRIHRHPRMMNDVSGRPGAPAGAAR